MSELKEGWVIPIAFNKTTEIFGLEYDKPLTIGWHYPMARIRNGTGEFAKSERCRAELIMQLRRHADHGVVMMLYCPCGLKIEGGALEHWDDMESYHMQLVRWLYTSAVPHSKKFQIPLFASLPTIYNSPVTCFPVKQLYMAIKDKLLPVHLGIVPNQHLIAHALTAGEILLAKTQELSVAYEKTVKQKIFGFSD
jgi:hypothetical protein